MPLTPVEARQRQLQQSREAISWACLRGLDRLGLHETKRNVGILMELDELTLQISDRLPHPWSTWSDWFGHCADVIAVLYLMRGKPMGLTLEQFLEGFPHPEMRKFIRQAIEGDKYGDRKQTGTAR